ncbi:hypothetical protein JTE90_013574 [Oedothorax gibbosus]|uniref:Uncharacterized protein n=1 Tax=Oedothorax gibbosus TaxID=931172 RepID=A0AAV6VG91_9ARAC|nr:hypothetical protein JTE90_013574 [Oedothorax gibbosus]
MEIVNMKIEPDEYLWNPLPEEVLAYLKEIDFPAILRSQHRRNKKKKAILNQSDHKTFQQFMKNLKKQNCPNFQLSSDVVKDFDIIINYLLDIFLEMLASLVRIKKTKNLSVKQLETVTKLCLPGSLCTGAMNYGRMAVSKGNTI